MTLKQLCHGAVTAWHRASRQVSSMINHIDIIRKLIHQEGGNAILKIRSTEDKLIRPVKIVCTVDKNTDGLTTEARMRVRDILNQTKGVECAYVLLKNPSFVNPGLIEVGHLNVVFLA